MTTPFKLKFKELNIRVCTYWSKSYQRWQGWNAQHSFLLLSRADLCLSWVLGCFWRSWRGSLWNGLRLLLKNLLVEMRCYKRILYLPVGPHTLCVLNYSRPMGFKWLGGCLVYHRWLWDQLHWNSQTGSMLLVLPEAKW